MSTPSIIAFYEKQKLKARYLHCGSDYDDIAFFFADKIKRIGYKKLRDIISNENSWSRLELDDYKGNLLGERGKYIDGFGLVNLDKFKSGEGSDFEKSGLLKSEKHFKNFCYVYLISRESLTIFYYDKVYDSDWNLLKVIEKKKVIKFETVINLKQIREKLKNF